MTDCQQNVAFLRENGCEVPVMALTVRTRKKLGLIQDMSNPVLLDTWNAFADEMGLNHDEIKDKDDNMCDLAELWSLKPNSTIDKLIDILEKLNKCDLLQDESLQQEMLSDVKLYKQQLLERSDLVVDEDHFNQDKRIAVPDEVEFKNITVEEEKSGKPQYFDAYVCYAEEDYAFVKTLMHVVEEMNGLKLFIKDRDLALGTAEDTVVTFIIKARCKKVLVLLSPEYLSSPQCTFLMRYAHGLCPAARSAKLIPLIIKQCQVPDILRVIMPIDLTRCSVVEWFWNRIVKSLRTSSSSLPAQGQKS